MKEEEKLAHALDTLGLDSRAREDNECPQGKNRAVSAPPSFDSSYLFLYQEDDVYTRSFTKGFINTRKDNFYNEFYEQYKHKKPNLPPPIFQEDFVAARESKFPPQIVNDVLTL